MRVVYAFLVGFSVGAGEVRLILIGEMSAAEAISALILGVTGYIVWEYTKAAQKSNEIQERPLLDLKIIKTRRGQNSIFKLSLINKGKTTAYNVRISPIGTIGGHTYGPYLEDDVNSRLEVGGEQEIKFWVKIREGALEHYDNNLGFERMLHRMFPTTIDVPLLSASRRKIACIFVIHFDGANGGVYHSVFRLYPSIALPLETDVMAQFILAGRGICTYRYALKICNNKPLLLHSLEVTDTAHASRRRGRGVFNRVVQFGKRTLAATGRVPQWFKSIGKYWTS